MNANTADAGSVRPAAPVVAVLDDDGFEAMLALDLHDAAMRAHLDVALGGELLDQVVRHAVGKRRPAHQERDLGRVAREEHRGLPRRVAAADQEHALARGSLSASVCAAP